MFKQTPETDNEIQVDDLKNEFRVFPSMIFSYLESKANAESEASLAKALYEEAEAEVYLEIKRGGEKVTEKNLEALIATDKRVKDALRNMLEKERDAATLKNYVESLRAKKDMLIQLGADARKE